MKFRRHTTGGFDLSSVANLLLSPLAALSRLEKRRGVLLWLGATVGTFAIGYFIAALVLFPAPIFASATAVPRVLGMPRAQAEDALRAAGLASGEVAMETHPTEERDGVIWQDPPPGTRVPQGHTVRLWVSAGAQRVPVGDFAGYDAELTRRLIEAAGLRVGTVESTQAPLPQGVVVNTRPPAGTVLNPGSRVTLVVSAGAPTIPVPDVVGRSPDEASQLLVEAGLVLGATTRRTSLTGESGRIIEQDPRAGTLAAPGTPVRVIIAR